jgi:D-aminoacyl-tRNA deacylase
MRAVVTRVRSASVVIKGETRGEIEKGFLILLGVKTGDTEKDAEKLADKITGLRVFEDSSGKMNVSLSDAHGDILVISQFTLYANCSHGRRPDFLAAARPETAIPLYEAFIASCRSRGFRVETGEFGADMQVISQNDGPVTLVINSEELK